MKLSPDSFALRQNLYDFSGQFSYKTNKAGCGWYVTTRNAIQNTVQNTVQIFFWRSTELYLLYFLK